jgi:hypothetical protein
MKDKNNEEIIEKSRKKIKKCCKNNEKVLQTNKKYYKITRKTQH